MRKALDGAFLDATAETAIRFQIAPASSGIPAMWLLDHSTTSRWNDIAAVANTPESTTSVKEGHSHGNTASALSNEVQACAEACMTVFS
jgi:hypothetical protein